MLCYLGEANVKDVVDTGNGRGYMLILLVNSSGGGFIDGSRYCFSCF